MAKAGKAFWLLKGDVMGSFCRLARLSAFAFFVACILPAVSVAAGSSHEFHALWLTTGQGAIKIDPATGGTVLKVSSSRKVDNLAVDYRHNVIWLYGQKQLVAFASDGSKLVDSAVPHNLHGGPGSGFVADGEQGAIWLAIKRDLYRFDAAGTLQASQKLDRNIDGLSLDRKTGHLWLATDGTLEALDAQGQAISQITLSGKGRVTAIAADGQHHGIWVARDHTIERYSDAGNLTFRTAVPFDGSSAFLAADFKGGGWLAGQHHLVHINSAGAVDFVFAPFAKGRIDGLAADPLTGSVWVAGNSKLKEYGLDSQQIREVALAEHKPVKRLAFYADTLSPTLSLTTPKAGSYTNDNTPDIALKYSDVGSGVDTGTIKILANDLALDLKCDSQEDRATCTPNGAIPDGKTGLKATVEDYAGNVSNTGKLSFTVDTMPPTINVTIPDYTNQPDFAVSGTLSERATLTINGHAVSVAGDLSFNYAPSLAEGANILHFVAVDLAGNRTALTRTIFLDTVPPAVPAGTLVSAKPDDDGKVTLQGQPGSVEAEVTVLAVDLRTGKMTSATADANGAFLVRAPGRPSDTYKIILSDRAGNESNAIYMAAGDPALDLNIKSPANGAEIVAPSVTVTGTLSGPTNTGVTVNGVTADVVNARFVATGVPLDKGANVIVVTATTAGGLSVTRNINLVSDGNLPALSLQADPATAVAPANISFDYAYRDPESIAKISYDFGADGQADYTSAPTGQPVEHVYKVPGVYSVGLTVTDKDGSQHHAERAVVIEDGGAIDIAIRQTWAGLNWALKIEDKGAAMHYLDRTARKKYGPVFDVLLPYMSDIIASYSPLAKASVASDFSEYAIRRTSNGQDSLFFIDFIKDGDGVWRLDSM